MNFISTIKVNHCFNHWMTKDSLLLWNIFFIMHVLTGWQTPKSPRQFLSYFFHLSVPFSLPWHVRLVSPTQPLQPPSLQPIPLLRPLRSPDRIDLGSHKSWIVVDIRKGALYGAFNWVLHQLGEPPCAPTCPAFCPRRPSSCLSLSWHCLPCNQKKFPSAERMLLPNG